MATDDVHDALPDSQARYGAGWILMRWYLGYPLVDVHLDPVGNVHLEEPVEDWKQIPTLHLLLIRCAGLVAHEPGEFLPLAEQRTFLADQFREYLSPDFCLDYLGKLTTPQEALDHYLAEARGFIDDHWPVVEALAETLEAQRHLGGDDMEGF